MTRGTPQSFLMGKGVTPILLDRGYPHPGLEEGSSPDWDWILEQVMPQSVYLLLFTTGGFSCSGIEFDQTDSGRSYL